MVEEQQKILYLSVKLAGIRPNLVWDFLFNSTLISRFFFAFPGRIIGLFRLSYLTPGLMAAGVTEVIVEKDQFVEAKDDTKTLKNSTPPTTTKALTHQSKKSK